MRSHRWPLGLVYHLYDVIRFWYPVSDIRYPISISRQYPISDSRIENSYPTTYNMDIPYPVVNTVDGANSSRRIGPRISITSKQMWNLRPVKVKPTIYRRPRECICNIMNMINAKIFANHDPFSVRIVKRTKPSKCAPCFFCQGDFQIGFTFQGSGWSEWFFLNNTLRRINAYFCFGSDCWSVGRTDRRTD